MSTFGFIGTGNMGGALIKAACSKLSGADIRVANRTRAKAAVYAADYGCMLSDNIETADHSDFIFLGVKPQMMGELLAEIGPVLKKRSTPFVLVSMAAGLSMETIREMAGGDYPVIRIMPNTPVAIGEGMTLYAATDNVTEQDLARFLDALSESGRFVALPEKLINAGSGVSGCGPAFVDLFVEALADGGVACGLPRATALECAAQMVLGSAKLILESGKHPGQLKDEVCSPGGTTIQGVRKLEEGGFRGTVMDAVIAAYEKNFKL